MAFLIGSQALPSQSQPADSPSPLRAGTRHDWFRTQFRGFLESADPGEWRAGWSLARDTGRSVAPLLWDLWKSETPRLYRRLLFLGAFGQAAGPSGDPSVDAVLAQLDDPEKLMSLVILALGPGRTHGMANLARLTSRDEKMVVRVAAYVALSRFETAVPPLVDRADPGLLAAALHAGLAPRPGELDPWFRFDEPRAAAHLVWRGFLLAEPSPDDHRAERLARAQQTYDGAEGSIRETRLARQAAALCLARLGDPTAVLAEIGEPEPGLLVLMAAAPEMRRAMPDGWFLPVPTVVRLDAAERRRLAVLYALKRPVQAVLDDAGQWGRDGVIRSAVCLALAWRLLGEEAPALEVPGTVAEVPEGVWVQWAAGGQPGFGEGGGADPILARAATLAVRGRLPAAAARDALEQALWRSGSHPSLGRLEAQVALLRDLVLSGSVHVSPKLGDAVEYMARYFAPGVPRSNSDFFEIAYEYLQFAAVPRSIPEALRLR